MRISSVVADSGWGVSIAVFAGLSHDAFRSSVLSVSRNRESAATIFMNMIIVNKHYALF